MRIDHRLLFHHKPQPVALAYCDKLCAASRRDPFARDVAFDPGRATCPRPKGIVVSAPI